MEGTHNHQQKSELQLKDVMISILNTVRARQDETVRWITRVRENESRIWERERERETGLNLNTWYSGSVSAAPVICCFFSQSLSLSLSLSLSFSDAGELWKGSTERYSFLGKEPLKPLPSKQRILTWYESMMFFNRFTLLERGRAQLDESWALRFPQEKTQTIGTH